MFLIDLMKSAQIDSSIIRLSEIQLTQKVIKRLLSLNVRKILTVTVNKTKASIEDVVLLISAVD